MKNTILLAFIFLALGSQAQPSQQKKEVAYDSAFVNLANWQDNAYVYLQKEKAELDKEVTVLNDRIRANQDKITILLRGLAKEAKADEPRILPNGIVYSPGYLLFKLKPR